MLVRLRQWNERLRSSLFYVPAFYIAGGMLLALVAVWFDSRFSADLPQIPLLLPTTVDSARAILGTVAGATITVAGIVFSVTVVAVQLASSQLSPRVLRSFLRDPVDQNVIGFVVGTFVYCLLVLAATPRPLGMVAPTERLQNVSVTLAVGAAIVAVLAIVKFIDHSAKTMQAGEVIRRITEETRQLIDRRFPLADEEEATGTSTADRHPPQGEALIVRAGSDGWVQQIDHRALLRAAPEGGVVRFESRVGLFVTEHAPMATVWPHPRDDDATAEAVSRVRSAVGIGGSRTMQQDVDFGIRQLVDIGLRALSPGVNDPTTAVEVLVHLGALIGHLIGRDLHPDTATDDSGRRLLLPHDPDLDDLVHTAFGQMRSAAADQPAVIDSLVRVLGQIAEVARGKGEMDVLPVLREEARLAIADLEARDHLDEDVAPVRALADRFALLEDPA